MTKVTQQDRLLLALERSGERGMSGIEFIHSVGCIDYRKRISDLRKMGYQITDRWEENERTGARFKRYFYKGGIKND